MEKLLIRLLKEEATKSDVKRRRGPILGVFGRRKNITLTLPGELIKKAKAMARVKKMSLSALVERLLIGEDEVYHQALIELLRADEKSKNSLAVLQTPGGEYAESPQVPEPRSTDRMRSVDRAYLYGSGATLEPESECDDLPRSSLESHSTLHESEDF